MEMSDSAADRLMGVVERMVRAIRVSGSAEPLSPAAGSALNTLRGEGPMGVTRLARTQGVSQPAMTQLVDRLAADGLVERQTQSDDRRAVRVALTPAGQQATTQRRARRVARFQNDLDSLSPAERTAIAAALPALENLVTAMVDAPPAHDDAGSR